MFFIVNTFNIEWFFVRFLILVMVRVWFVFIFLLNMFVRVFFCMVVREICLDGVITLLDDGGGDLVGLVVGLIGFVVFELVSGWVLG